MRCLDLVEYDGRRHEKLAQYVFGGSLVCANADIAQKITYQSNRRLAFPSVTVEGDVFQTGGVMSGGASKHHRQTLLLWKNFKRCSQLAGDLQERLKQIDFYLLPMEELGQKHARITRDLRLALNELQNLESAFAASTAGSERRRIGEMEERKEECARRLETLHTEKTSILEEIRKLEKEVYELHHHRDKLEGSLKKEVKELRQKVKSLEAKAATLQLETAQFRQELGVLEKEVLSVQQDIETRTKHLQDLENSIQDRITLVEEQKALVESVRKEIEKCLAEAAVSDKRHGDIASKLKKLQKQKEHYTLSLKKYQHSMDDREKNIQAARRVRKDEEEEE
ncbi:SMC protein, partial [Cystoisospora suis]